MYREKGAETIGRQITSSRRTNQIPRHLVVMITLLLLSFSCFVPHASARKGDISTGTSVGYASGNKSVTLGVDFRYQLLEEFRFAPSFTYLFRKNHLSACFFDFDAHYMVELSKSFSFYPIGGLSLSMWSLPKPVRNEFRVGVNLGIGCEVLLTDELSAGVDLKYNAILNFDQTLITFRVGYHF